MTITAPARAKHSAAATRVMRSGQLDATDAVLLLREVVYAKGADHVIKECTYFETNEVFACNAAPVCIIGHLFALLGKDRDDLEKLPGTQDPRGANVSKIDCISVRGLYITPNAVAILQRAQTVQDGYEPWGAALAAAEEVYRDQRAADYSTDNATDGIDAGPSVEDMADQLRAAILGLDEFVKDKALGMRLRRALREVIDTANPLIAKVEA